jgi:hypothetical protein
MPARTPESRAIRRLLAARGIPRYALFLTQREGKALPNGLEALSGFVLTPDGAVHGFWLDWDPTAAAPTLDPWYPVPDPSPFAADPEYRRARRRLKS